MARSAPQTINAVEVQASIPQRKGQLAVTLPAVPRAGSTHLVIDSTGIKVYGEGQWKTHQRLSPVIPAIRHFIQELYS